MDEKERAGIVALIDDCKARGVRYFKRGDLEFTIEQPREPRPAKVPALSRLKGGEA